MIKFIWKNENKLGDDFPEDVIDIVKSKMKEALKSEVRRCKIEQIEQIKRFIDHLPRNTFDEFRAFLIANDLIKLF